MVDADLGCTEQKLDEALARVAATEWIAPPRSEQFATDLRASVRSRHRRVWLFLPLLAACASATFATVQRLYTVPVAIELEHGMRVLHVGSHQLTFDQNGALPIVVDVPGFGLRQLQIELPAGLDPEVVQHKRVQVRFTTDPGCPPHTLSRLRAR